MFILLWPLPGQSDAINRLIQLTVIHLNGGLSFTKPPVWKKLVGSELFVMTVFDSISKIILYKNKNYYYINTILEKT